MNILIAGSREFNDYKLLEDTLNQWADSNPDFSQEEISIVSGMARGADKLGVQFAEEYGLKLISMPADWNTYGKSAGYKRNEAMAKITDIAFIFWDGQSKGTKHMIDLCHKYYITTQIIEYNKAPWE